jgi:hypothetical protein
MAKPKSSRTPHCSFPRYRRIVEDGYGGFFVDEFDTPMGRPEDHDSLSTPNLSGYTPNQIVAQERSGVEQNKKFERIPKECGNRADWEKLGFKFREEPCDDNLFVNVDFPEGWKNDVDKKDYRNIIIVDDKGRRRASGFFKNASYDRYASMHLCRRFEVTERSFNDYTVSICYVIDNIDPEKPRVIFCTEPRVFEGRDYFNFYDREGQPLKKDAFKWLDDNYPNWKSPDGHWDALPAKEVCKFPDWKARNVTISDGKDGEKSLCFR